MSEYRATKLYLTTVEQEQTQAELHRALKRRTFSARQAREKDARLGRLLMRADLLVEEMQELLERVG